MRRAASHYGKPKVSGRLGQVLPSAAAARVRALTAGGLAHVIDDGSGFRLQVCQRGGCETAFLDVSRNGRRRFCSLRCANQVNVANHRRRAGAAAGLTQDAAVATPVLDIKPMLDPIADR